MSVHVYRVIDSHSDLLLSSSVDEKSVSRPILKSSVHLWVAVSSVEWMAWYWGSVLVKQVSCIVMVP